MGAGKPDAVLGRLAEIEGAATAKPVKIDRPLKVEFELLGDVEPLPADKPVPDTVSRRGQMGGKVRHGSSPMSLPARAGGRR